MEALTVATAGVSMAGSILGGYQQAGAFKAQAKQSEISARAEELKGRDQALKIKNDLLTTLASQNAAFAARGISLNSGTTRNLAAQSNQRASEDIQRAQFGTGMAAAAERGTAVQQRNAAKSSILSGYTSAAGTASKTLGSIGGM